MKIQNQWYYTQFSHWPQNHQMRRSCSCLLPRRLIIQAILELSIHCPRLSLRTKSTPELQPQTKNTQSTVIESKTPTELTFTGRNFEQALDDFAVNKAIIHCQHMNFFRFAIRVRIGWEIETVHLLWHPTIWNDTVRTHTRFFFERRRKLGSMRPVPFAFCICSALLVVMDPTMLIYMCFFFSLFLYCIWFVFYN